MRPQTHSDAYKYRTINLQGEPEVPDFNSKKYGRNSIRSSSALLWNFFKKIFPEKDFLSLTRDNLKNLIINYYTDKYKTDVLE